MCQGLNCLYFHIIGNGKINPIVGVYIPIIRIPLKGGMTIPNIATFDHVTHNSIKFGVRKKTTHFLRPFKRVLSPRVSCVELCVGKKRDGSRGVKKRLEIQLGA